MPKVSELMSDAHKSLSELADKLRGALHNENLADVVANAAGKCKQASEHADAQHEVYAIHDAAETGEKIANPDAAALSGKPPETIQHPKEKEPAPFVPGLQFPGQDPSQFGSG